MNITFSFFSASFLLWILFYFYSRNNGRHGKKCKPKWRRNFGSRQRNGPRNEMSARSRNIHSARSMRCRCPCGVYSLLFRPFCGNGCCLSLTRNFIRIVFFGGLFVGRSVGRVPCRWQWYSESLVGSFVGSTTINVIKITVETVYDEWWWVVLTTVELVVPTTTTISTAYTTFASLKTAFRPLNISHRLPFVYFALRSWFHYVS